MDAQLTKAQKGVLRLIFEHKLPEEEALEEAEISRRVFEGWFRQKLWLSVYEGRMKNCQRQAELIIAMYKETAAMKLITLCNCEKEAVARTACLDVLNMETETAELVKVERKMTMKPETQAAILKIMAEAKEKGKAASPRSG